LLVERCDLPGALDWATAGVELCLQREAGRDAPLHPGGPEPDLAGDDPAELRLLLSLRYRIRNDLGLPEDDYDRLLDETPSGGAGERVARTVSESDAASTSTMTSLPSAMSPDSKPRAS
jgi:hypothetical protein